METLSPVDILDRLDEIICSLESNESVFYVAIDMAYQLRDEVKQAMPDYDDNR